MAYNRPPSIHVQQPPPEDDSAIDSDTDREAVDNDHVLQIIFDPQVQASRRRKSSLVNMEEEVAEHSSSSCFVHALLETQKNKRNDNETVYDGTVEKVGVGHRIKDCSSSPSMTKLQLSDMVLGVRELSKHLASLRIRMQVRNIFVLTKTQDRRLVGQTRMLAQWLMENNYNVYVDHEFRDKPEFDSPGLLKQREFYSCRLRYWTPELCAKRPHMFDFVLTLGGDGTVLYASWLFQKVVPPVLSFSLGSLGFLTKFDFEGYEGTLSKALNKGVTIGLKLRFEGTIMRALPQNKPSEERDLTNEILSPEVSATHTPAESHNILNEIVVDRGPNPTMSTTELYGDDMFLTSISADGVCIATPTGSTAYNLAAGGSLCHPEIPGMLVSVICAHSLSFRPLILPDSMVLRVGVPFNARTTAWVSFDGRKRIELRQGDYVSIIASRFPFPTVQSKRDNKDWFDSLRRTMNWGVRTAQTPFS